MLIIMSRCLLPQETCQSSHFTCPHKLVPSSSVSYDQFIDIEMKVSIVLEIESLSPWSQKSIAGLTPEAAQARPHHILAFKTIFKPIVPSQPKWSQHSRVSNWNIKCISCFHMSHQFYLVFITASVWIKSVPIVNIFFINLPLVFYTS